jgi:hypothetical protein
MPDVHGGKLCLQSFEHIVCDRARILTRLEIDRTGQRFRCVSSPIGVKGIIHKDRAGSILE